MIEKMVQEKLQLLETELDTKIKIMARLAVESTAAPGLVATVLSSYSGSLNAGFAAGMAAAQYVFGVVGSVFRLLLRQS
ncbi:hypothetical protein C8R46DRAFT_1117868 [Mycena filopes]|nr:hypothetical protein C8R46DRAFT_1117868 [Mycena filopes]